MSVRVGQPNGWVLYIAGPMTGYPEFNAPAFRAAARDLRAAGYVVISPVEMDEADGVDLAAEGDDAGWVDALTRDLVVVAKVDGIAALDHWEESRGARLEIASARGQRKPVRPVEDWLSLSR